MAILAGLTLSVYDNDFALERGLLHLRLGHEVTDSSSVEPVTPSYLAIHLHV
jgi:hypothetical protein